MRWSERARERLRPGETVAETIPIGSNGIVVTDQRVLAFTPDGEGPNFRAIERPNVEGVRLDHVGATSWLEYVGKGALAGVVGVALGLTLDLGGMFALGGVSGEGASAVGAGGLTRLLGTLNAALDAADEALLVGGLLALVFALGAFGMYVESRSYNLVIGVAGDEDLHVRAPSSADDQDRRLERALGDGAFGPGPEEPVPAEESGV